MPYCICQRCGKPRRLPTRQCRESTPSSRTVYNASEAESSGRGSEVSGGGASGPPHQALLLSVEEDSVPPIPPGFFREPQQSTRAYHASMAPRAPPHEEAMPMVLKWARKDHECGESFATITPVIANHAAQLVLAMRTHMEALQDWRIFVNNPTVLSRSMVDGQRRKEGRDTPVLLERYLANTKKYNSNSGWSRCSNRMSNQIIQALSHFSYVFSEGKTLLCNVQAAVDNESKVIIIAEAAMLSQRGGVFGCADTGMKGIQAFFTWHDCNNLCRQLPKPKGSASDEVLFVPEE